MGCYICVVDEKKLYTGSYCEHLDNTLGDEGKYLYLNCNSIKDVFKIINSQKSNINTITLPKSVNKTNNYNLIVNEMITKGKKNEKIYIYDAKNNKWLVNYNDKITPLFFEIIDKNDILNDFNKVGFFTKGNKLEEMPSETKNRLKIRTMAACILYNAIKFEDLCLSNKTSFNDKNILFETAMYAFKEDEKEYKWAYDYDFIDDPNDYMWALFRYMYPSLVSCSCPAPFNVDGVDLMTRAERKFIKELVRFSNNCNSYYLRDLNENLNGNVIKNENLNEKNQKHEEFMEQGR